MPRLLQCLDCSTYFSTHSTALHCGTTAAYSKWWEMEINFLVFRYLSTGNIYHIIITNTKSNIFYILNLLIKNACLWFLTVQSPLRCWVGRCPHEDMDMVFLVHLQLPVKLHPDTRHVHTLACNPMLQSWNQIDHIASQVSVSPPHCVCPAWQDTNCNKESVSVESSCIVTHHW